MKTVLYKDATAFFGNPASSEVVLYLSVEDPPAWIDKVCTGEGGRVCILGNVLSV